MLTLFRSLLIAISLALPALVVAEDSAPAEETRTSIAKRIDQAMEPIAKGADDFVFWGPELSEGQKLPLVIVILGGTAVFLTIFFKFINLRGFGISLRTVKGKYTPDSAPGQITHFQALSAALSATVGLGNIGGVAIAIGIGGPGATLWMILLGLCGMTTKFAECTLGVKYRRIDEDGTVKGGAMYYLRDGFKKFGNAPMKVIGAVLAVLFALFVIGGAFGAGNMYQSNQAFSQFGTAFLGEDAGESSTAKLSFGIVIAILVALVIIGGIVRIAQVTAFLVPFMCGAYVLAALIIIGTHLDQIGPAFSVIFASAFGGKAAIGGFIGTLINGLKRGTFSNEAGLGSAAIAHSAVKTDHPASEGFVALLEPFIDTVVVCTMTALVIVITGTWKVSSEVKPDGAQLVVTPESGEVIQDLAPGQFLHNKKAETFKLADDEEVKYHEVIGFVSADNYDITPINGWVKSDAVKDNVGVPMTSMAFASVLSWFPYILTAAVILFAFSTMISWSYYGEQGVRYLFSFLDTRQIKIPVLIYKILFCLLIIVGAAASLDNVLAISDAMLFAMLVPNLIGLYFLLPVVHRETKAFLTHVKEVDGKKS